MTPETTTKYVLQRLPLDNEGYERGEPEFYCSAYVKEMWQTDINKAIAPNHVEYWKKYGGNAMELGYSYRIITIIDTTHRSRSLLS